MLSSFYAVIASHFHDQKSLQEGLKWLQFFIIFKWTHLKQDTLIQRHHPSQAGRQKVWDLMKSHSSVAIVIFRTDIKK